MAFFQGKTSKVYTATTQGGALTEIGQCNDWSIDASAATEDTSVLGDNIWGSKTVVTASFSGSTSGFFDAANTLAIGDVIWFKGEIDASNYRYGKATITGENISANVGGVVKQNFTFEGAGELFVNAVS